MEIIQAEEDTLYKRYKKGSYIFFIVYPIIFIISHTWMLISNINNMEISKDVYYIIVMVSEGIIFISFLFLSCNLMNKLKLVYPEFSSKLMQCLLYLFSCLLFTRLSVGVLYVTAVIEMMRKKGLLFLYIIVSSFTFEFIPAILLLILSKLQSSRKEKTNKGMINLKIGRASCRERVSSPL